MQLSREPLNVLPKNPDNTRKNDYESKIRTKDIRQNVFSRNKVREGVKKVISRSSGGKIQSRVFQGLYLIMKFP